MKITRTSFAVAIVSACALALTACGSDSNSTPASSAAAAVTSASAAATDSSSAAMTSSSAAMTSSSGAMTSSSEAMTSTGSGATGGTTFESAGFKCATGTLRSSGSTAQGTVMAQWINDYNAKCGASINAYGGGGSGKGVTDFTSNQTDFGGSDSALKTAQFAAAKTRCSNNDAIDLPMVTGPIAIAYNLPGNPKLIVTPQILVDIFGGKVTNWNNAEIAKANPGVTLPTLAIATVHRSDSSGTTDNFTKYLIAAGGWTFAGGKSWTAPGGTGGQGSDGAAKAVASTTGSIGYVEWGFATTNNLTMASVDNGGGAVALTGTSAGLTVSSAKVVGTGKDLSLSINYATKVAGAYPIVLVTYEIVCSAGNGDKAALLKAFLGWTATDGQAELGDKLGAAPLPAAIQTKVIAAVTALS